LLSGLQLAIAGAISKVAEVDGFALAGGAALIALGVVDRATRDLDYFTRTAEAVNSSIGTVLSLEELAADKTLALFGRAAARDYIDVKALAGVFGIERLCQLAAEKDRGFDRIVLAQAIEAVDRLSPERFELTDESLQELKRWATDTADALRTTEPDLGRDHGTGGRQDPDLGPGL
jgi:hypothetical protein